MSSGGLPRRLCTGWLVGWLPLVLGVCELMSKRRGQIEMGWAWRGRLPAVPSPELNR
jgi:hypothetical protein